VWFELVAFSVLTSGAHRDAPKTQPFCPFIPYPIPKPQEVVEHTAVMESAMRKVWEKMEVEENSREVMGRAEEKKYVSENEEKRETDTYQPANWPTFEMGDMESQRHALRHI